MAIPTQVNIATTPWSRAAQLQHLYGISVLPSDAQQMLLEMVPDARWEIVSIADWRDVEHARDLVAIRTRVTVLKFIDVPPDVVIDVLNEETRTEEVPHALDRTSTNPVAGYSVAGPLRAARPIAG